MLRPTRLLLHLKLSGKCNTTLILDMASVDLSGTWKLVKSDNLDKFLKACGVGMVHRTMASKVCPTVSIIQKGSPGSGDAFEIVTKTPLKSQEMRFRVDEMFRCNIPWETTDREMKASWEQGEEENGGNKLVVRLVADEDGSGPVFTRYLEGDQLVLVQTKSGVEAKRYFKRVAES